MVELLFHIAPDQKSKFPLRIFPRQRFQRIDRVTSLFPLPFDGGNLDRFAKGASGKAAHLEAVFETSLGLFPKGVAAHRNHQDAIDFSRFQRPKTTHLMSEMRRVERSAEITDSIHVSNSPIIFSTDSIVSPSISASFSVRFP